MATEPGVLVRGVENAARSTAIPAFLDEEPNARTWTSVAKDFRNSLGARLNTLGLEHRDFSIISNDCWGRALYTEWGLPCRTPMAGSGLHADCFLRLLGDIPGYLNAPLHFVPTSRHASVNRLRMRREPWPIAVLRGDVEIHFLHYRTEDQSRRAWDESCQMLNLDRLAVKFTVDKDGATAEHIARFDKMQFDRKLLISERPHPEISCAVQVPHYIINGAMMFRRSLKYFDCAHWLNTGEIRRNTPRVYINKLLYARGV